MASSDLTGTLGGGAMDLDPRSARRAKQYESWVLPVAISTSVTRLPADMTAFRDRQGKRQDLTLAPLLRDEELSVRFSDFPWAKKATIEQLLDLQRPAEDHLYWPQLEVDRSVESIRKPENFPLVSRSAARSHVGYSSFDGDQNAGI
jgi:hypothetical protein